MKRIAVLPIHAWKRCQSSLTHASGAVCPNAVEVDGRSSSQKSSGEESPHEENVILQSDNKKLFPRKKFAILMAYCGHRYHGMQVNHGVAAFPTIEGALISALIKVGCVPEWISSEISKLNFQRCSRTDTGVSAVGQLVSTRLVKSSANPVEEINSHLPSDIRIMGTKPLSVKYPHGSLRAALDIKRVTKGFNSKNMCDSRTYSYMLPTYALSDCSTSAPDPNFRLSREGFHRVNIILSFYRGVHNYHNFTSKKTAEDQSARRNMFSVSCSEPFVHQGIEFASIMFTGQSFMKHQIRKMVAMVIAIARGNVRDNILPHCVQMGKINIPKAPGLGLVLEYVYFGDYNRRYGADHETLNWDDYLPAMKAFREEKITPVIVQGELEDLSMSLFLDTLKQHDFVSLK